MGIVIPYVKQTWTDGSSQANAARLGVLEEGILDVSQAPAVHVYHNANQLLTSATVTALSFNSERFDQAGGTTATHHDTVTNNSRLTCLYAGIYLVTFSGEFAANATGQRYFGLRVTNGTIRALVRGTGSGTYPFNAVVSQNVSLAVNDYVEVVAYQDSGAGLNVTVQGDYSPEFSMVRVA